MLALGGMLLSLTAAARASVKPASIFGDHMVLQRGMKVPVWGAAPPGEMLPCQLIGLDVVLKGGVPFGVVVDMLLGTVQDCLIIEKDAERYLVPNVPDLVRKVSIEEGIVEIDPPEGLLDLRW